ncbi:MAG: hypothetical protein IT173_14875 [Acidobacteria bacterium]|nr:hypothetical protein [Acidobacteriota bacterium]
MKTIQRLEIGAGLATFVATLLISFLLFFPALRLEIEDRQWDVVLRYLISGFVFCVLPACLIGFGSISHALRQNRNGVLAVLLGGVVLIPSFCLGFLGAAVYRGWLRSLFMTLPVFLAAFTILLAFGSRSNHQPMK